VASIASIAAVLLVAVCAVGVIDPRTSTTGA